MKILNRIHATLAIAIICFSNNSISKEEPNDWAGEINKVIANELLNSGTPSLQVAIGKNGRIVFQATQGMSDIENRTPATNSSKYRVGSVSKWFTSTAAAVLVEKGIIDVDVPIQTYCPQFPKKRWAITTKNLLTHTSGIRHYIDYEDKLKNTKNVQERESISRKRDSELLSSFTRYEDVITPLEGFKNDPLLFEPNTSWNYSSYGYRVLACVLEGASKMSYSKIMDELIFKKSNMTSTVKDDAWKIISDRTSGYRLNRKKSLRRADMRDTSENLPAGGHLSTATDLVLFALTMNSGKLSFSKNGLKNHARKTAKKNTIGQESSWRNAIPSKKYYGVGEMFFPDKSRLWVGHTGRIAGGSAIVVLQPKSDLTIAVTTNAKGWNGYISFIDKIKLILEESSDLNK